MSEESSSTASAASSTSTTSTVIPEGMYEVEKIINHKVDEDLWLLVRWVGYGPDDDTWEPERDVKVNAREAVNEYYNNMTASQKDELMAQLKARIAENEEILRKREKRKSRSSTSSTSSAKKRRRS